MKALFTDETLHNWSNLYSKLPEYAGLSEKCRSTIKAAELDHHRGTGLAAKLTTRELADAVVARHYDELANSAEWIIEQTTDRNVQSSF